MESKYNNFAKKVGFKKKNGLYYDKLGFVVNESDIKQMYSEIERITSNVK